MARGYSQDLRDKVMEYVAGGHSCNAAAQLFSIGANTVRNWHKRMQEEGHCRERKRMGKKPRLTRDEFLQYIAENEGCTLLQVGRHFKMTDVGAYYYMKKFGLRFKKRAALSRGLPEEKRAIFRGNQRFCG